MKKSAVWITGMMILSLTSIVHAEENNPLEYYNQNGYVIRGIDYTADDEVFDNKLTIEIENQTKKGIFLKIGDCSVNHTLECQSKNITVPAGKTKMCDFYVFDKELDSQGYIRVEVFELNLSVCDAKTYYPMEDIGPLEVVIDNYGKLCDHKIYRDMETVLEVQNRLANLGYDCGTRDGVTGPVTEEAIVAFEKEHNLPEDSNITDEFLKALREME